MRNLKNRTINIDITTDFNDVLADKEIAGIVIALPAELHFEFAEKALKKCKDVYVEKPLCLHLDHAKKLNELATKISRF